MRDRIRHTGTAAMPAAQPGSVLGYGAFEEPIVGALRIVQAAVRRHVTAPEQADATIEALYAFGAHPTKPPPLAPVYLPLLIYAGITGEESAALPIAAAALSLWLALGFGPNGPVESVASFVGVARGQSGDVDRAVGACDALAQLLLTELDVPATMRVALQHVLARGRLRVAAARTRHAALLAGNQLPDLLDDFNELEATITGAHSEAGATIATLAARFAGAPSDLVAIYADFGRTVCAADQLLRECVAYFCPGGAVVLGSPGVPAPLPLAWALRLARCDTGEREILYRLMSRAYGDAHELSRLRDRLTVGVELRSCGLLLEVYRQRALRILEEAEPRAPARARLEARLDALAFHPRRFAP